MFFLGTVVGFPAVYEHRFSAQLGAVQVHDKLMVLELTYLVLVHFKKTGVGVHLRDSQLLSIPVNMCLENLNMYCVSS